MNPAVATLSKFINFNFYKVVKSGTELFVEFDLRLFVSGISFGKQ